ncbi:unnamed protein product, partial [Brassica napus]
SPSKLCSHTRVTKRRIHCHSPDARGGLVRPRCRLFAKHQDASHHVFTSFCRKFFRRISLLYPRHHHLFDRRRRSTLHLRRSRSYAHLPRSRSPCCRQLFFPFRRHRLPRPPSSPSPPPRSFSPLLSMLPEAPNLLNWRVSSPDMLPSPSQTTIVIGGVSFILANLLFCSAFSRTLSPSLRHNLSRSSS